MTQTTSGANSPPAAPADSPRIVTVGGFKWQNAFEFTHLFRGFRLSTNPAKLFVALVAILIIYAGGRLFDAAWGPQVGPGEIESYQTLSPEAFREARQKFMDGRPDVIAEMVQGTAPGDKQPSMDDVKYYRDHPRSAYRYVTGNMVDQFHRRVAGFHDDRVALEKLRAERDRNLPKGADAPVEKSPAEIEQEMRRDAASRLHASVLRAQDQIGRGAFDSFMDYELRQFDALLQNALSPGSITPPTSGDKDALWKSNTVVGCVANMVVTGPKWLFTASGPLGYHSKDGFFVTLLSRGLYILSLVLFALLFLVTAAFSGAVICRMTALEFAGVERPPLAEIFGFARRKLRTFVAAPLTPFVILLIAGMGLAVVSLIGAIPWVGEIVAGILFFISLAVGFVLMLVLMGILAGYNLIFPTIAAEGTDTFDAMSRAFAYVYARPWRLAFYTLVILVYGAITVLFVSFAIYLLLMLTHFFAGMGINGFGLANGTYSGQNKMDTLWPAPQFGHLITPTNWWAMSWSESIGSMFLHFWVYLLISLVGAYVVSYYHSSHTILYFLLRRSVEGQSLTDVYYKEEPPVEIAAGSVMAASETPAAPVAAAHAASPEPSSAPPAAPTELVAPPSIPPIVAAEPPASTPPPEPPAA